MQPERFFNRVNLFFVIALFAFSAMLAVSVFVDAPTFSTLQTTEHAGLLVRGHKTSRIVTERGGWRGDSFIPVAEADPNTKYFEVARD